MWITFLKVLIISQQIIKFKFNNTNDWEIKLKLFEDQNINSLFINLPQKLNYIFSYYPVDYYDIIQETSGKKVIFAI